ncbi:MAG: hypothetical protein ACKVYV_04805 [Limisphaerales bacterium]
MCIKPYAGHRAAGLLRGTGIHFGTVIGTPHGNSATDSKRREAELACRDDAVGIDRVINLGKALSGDWAYVGQDVRAVCDGAHRHGAKLRMILEKIYLTLGGAGLGSGDLKRKLRQGAGADRLTTSSGYSFLNQPDGRYHCKGATERGLALIHAGVSAGVR